MRRTKPSAENRINSEEKERWSTRRKKNKMWQWEMKRKEIYKTANGITFFNFPFVYCSIFVCFFLFFLFDIFLLRSIHLLAFFTSDSNRINQIQHIQFSFIEFFSTIFGMHFATQNKQEKENEEDIIVLFNPIAFEWNDFSIVEAWLSCETVKICASVYLIFIVDNECVQEFYSFVHSCEPIYWKYHSFLQFGISCIFNHQRWWTNKNIVQLHIFYCMFTVIPCPFWLSGCCVEIVESAYMAETHQMK